MTADKKTPDQNSVSVTLDDGTTLLLRTLRPDDAEGLRAAFDELSDQSRYFRFLYVLKQLPDSMLQRLTGIDHFDQEAWVAIDEFCEGGPLGVGLARYVRSEDDPEKAEVAIVVVDAYHHMSVATHLMYELGKSALNNGITTLTASMVADNDAVQGLIRHFGGQVREVSPRELELEFDLRPFDSIDG